MINDEELINKFKDVEVTIVYIDDYGDRCFVSDKMKYISADNCATVAKEYSNTKLEELEKYIDEYKDEKEKFNVFTFARKLKEEIKRLKK